MGVWLPFLEIGRNCPFFAFFPEGLKSTWEIQKTQEKSLFPQISLEMLKHPTQSKSRQIQAAFQSFLVIFDPFPSILVKNSQNLEREELGPQRSEGVRINPSFF